MMGSLVQHVNSSSVNNNSNNNNSKWDCSMANTFSQLELLRHLARQQQDEQSGGMLPLRFTASVVRRALLRLAANKMIMCCFYAHRRHQKAEGTRHIVSEGESRIDSSS